MSKWDLDDTGYEDAQNDICQVIFEGEDTETGRQITLQRIKECVNYDRWLKKDIQQKTVPPMPKIIKPYPKHIVYNDALYVLEDGNVRTIWEKLPPPYTNE